MNDRIPKFRMPPEWEHQLATWFSWPHNRDTWPRNLVSAQDEFLTLIDEVAEVQHVNLLAPEACVSDLANKIGKPSQVFIHPVETNDAWIRDYGPTFVINQSISQLSAISWHYNGWGQKYPPFDLDQAVAKRVSEIANVPLSIVDFCLEGGAIEVDGAGLLLTTSCCVLNSNRNPDTNIDYANSVLSRWTGTEHVLWLPHATIQGDDTDGHIDQLARFTTSGDIVFAGSPIANRVIHKKVHENVTHLQSQLSKLGRHDINLIEMPTPEPMQFHGRTIPASYCNFLICNEKLIVPQFGVPEDEIAVDILKAVFAERTVVGLPSRNLAVGLGSFHCLSQQQPCLN
ncbi:MAG: agmatine deiminase family protein [Planctomycetota bacterium]